MPKGENGRRRSASTIGSAAIVSRVAKRGISEDIKKSSEQVTGEKAVSHIKASAISQEGKQPVAKGACR